MSKKFLISRQRHLLLTFLISLIVSALLAVTIGSFKISLFDILLGKFAESYLHYLSDENLKSNQKLLDSGDPRIWRLSIDVEKTKFSFSYTSATFFGLPKNLQKY